MTDVFVGGFPSICNVTSADPPAEETIKVLDSELQKRLDGLLVEDAHLCCPVTLLLLQEPMVASDGFVYEADALQRLISAHGPSPMTMEKLGNDMLPAEQKIKELDAFRARRAGELLDFAEEASSLEPAMSSIALRRAQDYLEKLGSKKPPILAERLAKLQ